MLKDKDHLFQQQVNLVLNIKHNLFLKHDENDLNLRPYLPFGVATKFVTEYGNTVDWATAMKVCFQFFCCCTIVHLWGRGEYMT